MRLGGATVRFAAKAFLTLCGVIFLLAESGIAQSTPYERIFAQPRVTVEKALKELQPASGGRLPVLDGFTSPGDRPLDRFQRGYYQCTVHVSTTPSGESLVRVSAKITAWYENPVSSKSGYQTLPSNGRLESDFLDQLEEKLGGKDSSSAAIVSASPTRTKSKLDASAPAISAPIPSEGMVQSGPLATSKAAGAPANSPFKLVGPLGESQIASLATQRAVADKHVEELTTQAKNLEEIFRNQSHPHNLVAVKKSNTPVLASPSESAQVLFLATAEDEFEILDMTASWVHVRISGLSRGWIRRSSLEMPGAAASVTEAVEPPTANGSDSASAKPFQVESEQVASFPGTWEPLRGKTVKIVSVQKTAGNAPSSDPRARLDFVKSLFDREYAELAQSSTSTAGVVLIFDSEDGGMVAATLPVLQQWKAGGLSDEGFWRRCLFDPPEMFAPSASR
jgi:hypothetical protein